MFQQTTYPIYRESICQIGKRNKIISCLTSIQMSRVQKLLNMNSQIHCNAIKTLPADAEPNSLSDHMSCIERIDF